MSGTLEQILYPVVDSVRQDIELKNELNKSPDARLFGEKGAFNSLGLVNFIIEVEEKIETVTGKSIRLASSAAMSRKHSPFRTLGTLALYIDELLQEENA